MYTKIFAKHFTEQTNKTRQIIYNIIRKKDIYEILCWILDTLTRKHQSQDYLTRWSIISIEEELP